MEIVINVSDEDYEYLKTHNKHGLYSSILNGTPLPKGHGRLIDADALKMDIRSNYGYEEYEKSEFCSELDDAPTIIEADKAESEDE